MRDFIRNGKHAQFLRQHGVWHEEKEREIIKTRKEEEIKENLQNSHFPILQELIRLTEV